MRRRIRWLISTATTLVTSFLVWSRKPAGHGMSNPPESPKPKSLRVFIETTPTANTSQRMLFYAANRLYHRGDVHGANKVYEHLVTELPRNRVVKYNLDLSRSALGLSKPKG